MDRSELEALVEAKIGLCTMQHPDDKARVVREIADAILVLLGEQDKGLSLEPSPSAEKATPKSAATEAERVVNEVRHGPWRIFYDPPPIPARNCDWGFAHDDFDASYEGEEDGWVSNGLGGRGASVEDCLSQIADIEAERGP